jgi:hypothetical protein
MDEHKNGRSGSGSGSALDMRIPDPDPGALKSLKNEIFFFFLDFFNLL